MHANYLIMEELEGDDAIELKAVTTDNSLLSKRDDDVISPGANQTNLSYKAKFKQNFPHQYNFLVDLNDVDWLQEYEKFYEIDYKNLTYLGRKLFACVKEGECETVREIMDECNNPRIWLTKDGSGFTLSYWVGMSNNQQLKDYYYQSMCQHLTSEGAEKDERGFTALHHAVFAEQPDNVLLSHLENGLNVDETGSSGMSPLYLAAACNHLQNAEFLLKNGAIVDLARDHDANTALLIAAASGHEDMVALLLQYGANAKCENIHGETPLIAALKNRHFNIAQSLIAADPNPNIEANERAIYYAAKMGDLTSVHLLFNHISEKIIQSCSKVINPLHIAAAEKHFDIVLYLLDQDASFCCVEDIKAVKEGVAESMLKITKTEEKKRLFTSALSDRQSQLSRLFFYPRWLFEPSIHQKRSTVHKIHVANEGLKTDVLMEEESGDVLSQHHAVLFSPPAAWEGLNLEEELAQLNPVV